MSEKMSFSERKQLLVCGLQNSRIVLPREGPPANAFRGVAEDAPWQGES